MDVRRDADADYILGSSESEQERLQAQGDAIAPLTERIFRQAGIGPGMRVLDVGCGVGDVSILVAFMSMKSQYEARWCALPCFGHLPLTKGIMGS